MNSLQQTIADCYIDPFADSVYLCYLLTCDEAICIYRLGCKCQYTKVHIYVLHSCNLRTHIFMKLIKRSVSQWSGTGLV